LSASRWLFRSDVYEGWVWVWVDQRGCGMIA
jgi:hypothetical protein